MGHTSLYLNPRHRYLGKLEGIVRWSKDCFCQVLADLYLTNIKGGHKINIAYTVSPQVNMHQPRHKFAFFRLLVIVDALYQG